MIGKRISDLEQVKSVSAENAYMVETEAGTRRISHKDLVANIEEDLPIGDMEELEKLEKLEDQEEQEPKKLTLVNAILKAFGKAITTFKGTDGVKAGTAGIVPQPGPNDKDSFLRGDGIWAKISGSGGGDVAAENVKFTDEKNAEDKLGAIDGITDDLNSENSRIAASSKALKQVNDSLIKNSLGTSVDISSYISSSNSYTCPSDGYVLFFTKGSGDNYLNTYAELHVNDVVLATGTGTQVHSISQNIYVKKGMKVYFTGSVVKANFIPIA